LLQQAQPAGPPTGDLAARGQALFASLPCAGCHRVRGTNAAGTRGPDLTKFATRSTIAALTLPNDTAHLSGWIVDAPDSKPGVLMPPITISPDAQRAIVAYLESLT
jgi:cytochrome c oxidase subunit 2